ncbi:MAG: hypothetical protein MUF75_13210 [Bacteroidia bacterium]|nr:hypothetical protein [Bacteroidia bacterium]
MNRLIKYFTENQRTLFLMDSLGALTTAFFLFVVLREFNMYFGMPKTVLTYLSVIAFCFCLYSTLCFLFLKGPKSPFIRLIGIANLLYCVLTIALVIQYYPLLTGIAILYFLNEIFIICALSSIEILVAARSK